MLNRLVLALFILISGSAFATAAKTLQPTLSLIRLKAIQTAEKNGDELYLAVTSYPSQGKPKHYQVPKYPLFWPSKKLDSLKAIHIWQAPLAPGSAVTLIISLMEQDTPPWNTDDLIGSIRLRLKNNHGELESSWSMPNRVDAPTSVLTRTGRAEKFDLLGEGSNYQLYLMLKLAEKKD